MGLMVGMFAVARYNSHQSKLQYIDSILADIETDYNRVDLEIGYNAQQEQDDPIVTFVVHRPPNRSVSWIMRPENNEYLSCLLTVHGSFLTKSQGSTQGYWNLGLRILENG